MLCDLQTFFKHLVPQMTGKKRSGQDYDATEQSIIFSCTSLQVDDLCALDHHHVPCPCLNDNESNELGPNACRRLKIKVVDQQITGILNQI